MRGDYDLHEGDLVEIVWDGGNGPHVYVVKMEHGIPVAWTQGAAPCRVSPISPMWIKTITPNPPQPAKKER